MSAIYTESDFETLSWHDCHVWRLELRVGEPAEDDWTSDLVLDLDYIAEWICGVDDTVRFRVAPATLVFHGVTDPEIRIGWGDDGSQTAIQELSIHQICRERIDNQKVYLDRLYYRWRIELNWPRAGEIAFGAVGFTQTLLAEPVLTDQQRLSRRQRQRLRGDDGWGGRH